MVVCDLGNPMVAGTEVSFGTAKHKHTHTHTFTNAPNHMLRLQSCSGSI